MKLPGRRRSSTSAVSGSADAAEATPAGANEDRADSPSTSEHEIPRPARGTAHTAGKGRPTPKRRDVERARGIRSGPVAPAPLTRKEARARRKEQKATMSKAERKAEASRRRQATNQAREKMMAGEERYLLARDKGPVRAFVRDLVDSRRHVLGLFMPAALLLVASMFLQSVHPRLYILTQNAFLVFVLLMVAEAIILGRRVTRAVRARFPESTDKGMALGWYSFVRASQPRRMRAPRPRVAAGDTV